MLSTIFLIIGVFGSVYYILYIPNFGELMKNYIISLGKFSKVFVFCDRFVSKILRYPDKKYILIRIV